MISNSLGDSEKFANLKNDLHRAAYMLLVTWADAEGRFLADPVSLRGKLYTRLPWESKQIEAALLDMHAVDLIRLYTFGGKRYGVVVKFHEHNTIRRREDGTPKEEAPSRLPAPPERVETDPGTEGSPEPYRSSPRAAQAEVEVEVEVEPQEEQDLQPSSAAPTRADRFSPFVEAWNFHCGVLPQCEAMNDKRRRGIDAVRKEFGDQALVRFEMAVLQVAADKFWQQEGYNIDNLLVRGRVLEKSEKFNANRGMSAGDRKLASTAMEIQRAIGGGLDA